MDRRGFLVGLGTLAATPLLARLVPASPAVAPKLSLSQRFAQQYALTSDENLSRIDMLLGAAPIRPRRLPKSQRKAIRKAKAAMRWAA